MGEPAGIGPDLLVRFAQIAMNANITVVGDPKILQDRAKLLNLPIKLKNFDINQLDRDLSAGEVQILPIEANTRVLPGKLSVENSRYVLACLDEAIKQCQTGQFDALVTCPIHKGIINEAGIAFTGHTEYLAQKTQTEQVVMMLQARDLRVALATTHIPLAAVSAHITTESLTKTLQIIQQDLQQRFHIAAPRMLVCGLNPHAGEGGYIGREEIDIIEPVIKKLQQQNMNITGPLPADTIFTPKQLATADVVLAMYHDQGLPVLKHYGFGEAVNITLGLPFLRVSVDHGTALDIVGTDAVDLGSLQAAINLAINTVKQG